jgi:hypothetical protein
MKARVLLAAPAFAALAAVAGLYDQPWSSVESGDNSETRKEATVGITQIDGKSTRNARRPDAVAPGKHQVTVRFDTGRGVVSDNERVLDMDLEACTRYRVVAAYTNKTSPEWKPRVYQEPLPDCAKKFKDKAAK